MTRMATNPMTNGIGEPACSAAICSVVLPTAASHCAESTLYQIAPSTKKTIAAIQAARCRAAPTWGLRQLPERVFEYRLRRFPEALSGRDVARGRLCYRRRVIRIRLLLAALALPALALVASKAVAHGGHAHASQPVAGVVDVSNRAEPAR